MDIVYNIHIICPLIPILPIVSDYHAVTVKMRNYVKSRFAFQSTLCLDMEYYLENKINPNPINAVLTNVIAHDTSTDFATK